MTSRDWDRTRRQERLHHTDTTPPSVREQRRNLYDSANALLRRPNAADTTPRLNRGTPPSTP